MPKCPKCGDKNPPENTVCRSCGSVLGVETTAEVPDQGTRPKEIPEWPAQTATPERQEPGEIAELTAERADDTAGDTEAAGPTLNCVHCQAVIAPGEALLLPGRMRVPGQTGGQQIAICPNCRAQIKARFASETQDVQSIRGALFGLAAAIVVGVAWYSIVHFSVLPDLPLMGAVGGWLIAEAVRYGAGRKRGPKLQWIALGLTALTILGTEYVLIGSQPLLFFQGLADRFKDPFTLVLFGLGLWQAYTIPRPRRLLGVRR